MNQTSTTMRSIMFAIVAMGIVFSVSGMVVGNLIQTANATHPGHKHNNDNDEHNDNNPTVLRMRVLVLLVEAAAMVEILGSPVERYR